MTEKTIKEGKTMAIVAYLTLIGTLIAFFINSDKKNPFTSFHIRQGLGLCLTYMACGYFIGYFNSWMVSTSFWIFFGILFLYGMLSAISGKTQETPILGSLFQEWFRNIN